MTATTSSPRTATPVSSPGGAFGGIMSTAIGVVSTKVDDWANRLEAVGAGESGAATDAVDDVADDLAEGGGAKRQAGVRGVQAGLEGKNPVLAAIRGAWAGGGTLVRAAVIAAGVSVVLLLVISPVPLLAFLLSALIIAAVAKARSART